MTNNPSPSTVLIVGDHPVSVREAIYRAQADIAAQNLGYKDAADRAEQEEARRAKLAAERRDPLLDHKVRVFHQPQRHQVLRCSHKFDPRMEPREANCQECWFAYFVANMSIPAAAMHEMNTNEDPAKAVEIIRTAHGKKMTKYLLRFLDGMKEHLAAQEQQQLEEARAEVAAVMQRPVEVSSETAVPVG